MCVCIVQKFVESQGSFVGAFCLCGNDVTEGEKHCVVACMAVMDQCTNYMLNTGDYVDVEKIAGVVHRRKLDGSSVSYFCVAVWQMFWSIRERMLETMECCGNVTRH